MKKITNNNENFCSKTGKKLNEVRPSCLIKILIPYECEYGHCPDKKLHILESEKEEEKTKNGGSEMEDLIKIAEEQIERLKKEQDTYDENVVMRASREIREWCYSIERCRALIQRDKAIQEMNEQMKKKKRIKNRDIEEVATSLKDVKVSEVIDHVTKSMKENMECKGAL